MGKPVNEQQKLEHLKKYIDYTRERIALLDRKCSIFIALETALVGVITFIVDKVCPPSRACRSTGYVIIAVSGALACVITLFLLATIRPGKRKHFFSSSTLLDFMDSQGIMWMSMTKGLSIQEFKNRVDSLNEQLIAEDLQAVAYNHFLLMCAKYRTYRPAARLLKIQMLLMTIVAILASLALLAAAYCSLVYGA